MEITTATTTTAGATTKPVAASLATIASAVTLVLLAGLHALSPEFDPSWRMVSEL